MKKLVLILLSLAISCSSAPQEAIVMGIGGPLTGITAQYGLLAKKGAELALDEINTAGRIHGRPLEVDFQDTQGDAKQAAAIAQKFIANPKVLLSTQLLTTNAMSVSSLYQKAGLVLFNFFTVHPDFTNAGDYLWSNAPPLEEKAVAHVSCAKDLGLKRIALFLVKTDIGKIYGDFLGKAMTKENITLAFQESYLIDEKDFRPMISKAKTAKVDGFILVGLLADASLLVKQIRALGFKQPIVAYSAVATDRFSELAGKASEGVYIAGDFAIDDPSPLKWPILSKNGRLSILKTRSTILPFMPTILSSLQLRFSKFQMEHANL